MHYERLFSIDIYLVISLAAAWLIELVLGTPQFFPDVSRLAGKFIKKSAYGMMEILDRLTAQPGGARDKHAKAIKITGIILVFYLLSFSIVLTAVLLDFARKIHPSFYYIFNILILCRVIKTRTAVDSASSMIKGARGKGYKSDREKPMISSVIAMLSKSYLDDVLGPILYISIGILLGIPAVFAVAYKTISLLDDAVGHKSNDFRHIGWAAAKFDDAVNFVPARLCGIVPPLAALICGLGASGMLRGFRATRDSHSARVISNNYTSPNDVWGEAAFAGALGVIIGGAAAQYMINSDERMKMREPDYVDVGRASRLMIVASAAILFICCGALLYFAIHAK